MHYDIKNLVFAVSISFALSGCGGDPDRLEEPAMLTTQDDVDLALMLSEMADRIDAPFGSNNSKGDAHDE